MSVFTDMYRGETRFDFVAASRRTLVVSAVLVVLSILLMIVRPFNLSIDFTGGTVITVAKPAGVEVSDVRDTLRGVGQAGATVQITGEGFILVRTEALSPDAQDELVAAVADVAEADLDEVNVDAVGPTFGAEVTRRAIQALAIFLVVVTLFITWRFEWKMALAALVALFHDLIITGGIYAAVGFVVTPATVIAVLTILGYSLYDTVVVFDKVTENVHEMHARSTYGEIVNLSMNQVLMRSINTSLTSLIPVGSLLFIGSFVLGAETLQEFALALFIGMAVGVYSSIFIATPLLAIWKEREGEWKRASVRASRRRGEEGAMAVETAVVTTVVAATDARARPPKQRKKRR
jgi:preprotein translocase subunit SecF